ncbi:MAG: hypothetical protein AAFW81_07585 [Pseudomonadota bacterium]
MTDPSRLINFSLEIIKSQIPTLHPYGFYILKNESYLPDANLRLHIWLSRTRRRQEPDWPPHTHNSMLSSFILTGGVTANFWIFRECSDGESQIYRVSYTGDRSIIKKTRKRGAIELDESRKLLQGDSYIVPPHVFHSTEVKPTMATVTFVLESKSSKGKALVAGEKLGDNLYEFTRRQVTKFEKKAVADLAYRAFRSLL